MTRNPTVFGNHYFTELLAGGGAFPSDKALLADPETLLWVRCVISRDRLLQPRCCIEEVLPRSVDVHETGALRGRTTVRVRQAQASHCQWVLLGDILVLQVEQYADDAALFAADFAAAFVKLGLAGADIG